MLFDPEIRTVNSCWMLYKEIWLDASVGGECECWGVCGGGGGGNVKGGYECVSPAVDDVTLREHKYI